MAGRVAMAIAMLMGSAVGGIYPEGHFDVSTKLTMGNYQDVIQSTIDDGKTLMVRFIASEG